MRHYSNTTEGIKQCIRDQFGREAEPISVERISHEGEFGGEVTGVFLLTTNDDHKYKLILAGTQSVSFFENPKFSWDEIIDIKEM